MTEAVHTPRAERTQALRAWVRRHASGSDPKLVPVAGDASFRRYFRLQTGQHTRILCDAPPETEKNREFVAVAQIFADAGVRVPAVLDADLPQGFLLLEDLGDQTLLPLLTDDNADGYYGQALAMLERLARIDHEDLDLPAYDRDRLLQEMGLFPRWFCGELLAMDLDAGAQRRIARLETLLCDRALAQTQVVVHRDFHARNLMRLADGTLGTIDFQDAVVGPVSYDPVSLLRDCYLRWPPARVREWSLAHRESLAARGLAVPPASGWLVDFDWMGLQRHIKVLGIFARLYVRDGKTGYLQDLPRVIAYVREVLDSYADDAGFADFARWFDAEVMPRAAARPWFRPS